MNKILKIEETCFSTKVGGWGQSYEGFIIQTEQFQLKLGISDGQSCCENSGYLMSLDDLNSFVGSNVISYSVVDDKLDTYELPEFYEASLMFVNIVTSDGTFQFTAYNEHNGYYGHEAVVIKDDEIIHSETL